MASNRQKQDMCTIEECLMPTRCKGLCAKHYQASILPTYRAKLATMVCSYDGCGESVEANKLCVTHYHRQWRHKQSLHPDERLVAYPKETLAESALRFWQRVQLTADDTRCWLLSGQNLQRYGSHSFDGEAWYAHHFAWFITHGYRSAMCLRHSCDTPRCVNPNHLSEGTHADNMHDKVLRGRQPHGEQVEQSKLTENDVRYIRQLLQNGVNLKTIAQRFPVSSVAIGDIKRGKTWRHVS